MPQICSAVPLINYDDVYTTVLAEYVADELHAQTHALQAVRN
jgi:hypothetical protein